MNALAGKIRVDFRAGEPLYMQIVRQFEQLMQRGELAVGDQLPTMRELATELRINFNTVARAYRILDETGLISTQRGRGTFAWERPSESAVQGLRKQELEALTRHYLEEAARLDFTPEEIGAAFKAQIAEMDGKT